MSSNRRQHTRNLKALHFTCYIDGQRFDARSIDVSVGGAFMETGALVPMGSVALIALKKGPAAAGSGEPGGSCPSSSAASSYATRPHRPRA